MFNTIFKIIYFIEFLLTFVIRKIYVSRYKKIDVKVKRKSNIEMFFLSLNGIAMILPLVYVLSPWLDFANYNLPNWIAWTGVILFAFAIGVLWKSHHDLGKNWSAIVSIGTDSELITKGIYKSIRHPMYTAHLIWAIAQILILHNWIVAYLFLIVQIPFYFIRIKNEEELMLKEFGSEYEAYMEKTKRLIPRVF